MLENLAAHSVPLGECWNHIHHPSVNWSSESNDRHFTSHSWAALRHSEQRSTAAGWFINEHLRYSDVIGQKYHQHPSTIINVYGHVTQRKQIPRISGLASQEPCGNAGRSSFGPPSSSLSCWIASKTSQNGLILSQGQSCRKCFRLKRLQKII